MPAMALHRVLAGSNHMSDKRLTDALLLNVSRVPRLGSNQPHRGCLASLRDFAVRLQMIEQMTRYGFAKAKVKL